MQQNLTKVGQHALVCVVACSNVLVLRCRLQVRNSAMADLLAAQPVSAEDNAIRASVQTYYGEVLTTWPARLVLLSTHSLRTLPAASH